MRYGTRLVGAFIIVGAGLLFAGGVNPSGQAQGATPPPVSWHVHIVDLSEGNNDPAETEALIDAELATFEQRCIDPVEFFELGRNQAPAIAIVRRC
jgi:hypothetical protein